MICSACRHENPAASVFCEECGGRLERRCPSCGNACAPAAKFCRSCGASLVARPAESSKEADARKVVTIVFADLIGSTALHERLDPESVSRVMERYHRAVRGPVEAHGGTVVQLLGDGVMCAFGVPRVAEDDAIRAVRAAVAVQRAFREFAQAEAGIVGAVGLRVAVNTGEVVVSDDYAAGIGDPLNVAARLQQEARDGDVLIGETTERLVNGFVTLEPIGELTLKGRAETVAVYRVVSLERPAGVSAVPFVGRDDELRRIMAVYDGALADRRARLTVVLGSPGLGKSRLLSEFARRLGDGASLLSANCEAAGAATFAPIARALRAHLGIDDAASPDVVRTAIAAATSGDESERKRLTEGIAALLGGVPAPPEETFFVVRRFLAGLAAVKPVVVVIDDLHWAEPLLLDLTEHLVQWTSDAPLLVLVAGRPELRDVRSSLTLPGGFVTEVVTLAGLDAGAATRLAANVIGADELPAAVAGRVLATSEGNPLFVGELVRMLVQEGALKREGDRWTAGADLAQLEMPPTIQALLAARIERLRPEDRVVLERAAVVGRRFSRAAVGHLLSKDDDGLDERFEALRRSELVESDTGWFLGDPVLRFRHVLIRDAAYRRLLKGTRAELHARFADWVSSRVGEAVEHDETIGWHLEQAHQHLRELGPIDEQGRKLGERAAGYLAAAGRRALARDDLPLAGGLLGRALERLDAADPARADLALDWCEALLSAGDVGPAAKAIAELGRFTADSARLKAWHSCFAGQLAALTDPQSLRATADAAGAAAEALAAAADAPGEAKAYSVQALALARLGKVGACEAALDRALAAARRGGDRRRSNAVLAGAPIAALWGPGPVTRASGRCLDVVRVLRITQGSPAVEAVALRCQGVLEALRGRGEAARRMIASSRRMVEELGITQRLLEADVFVGLIELLEGDAAAAERSLRAAYEGLRDQGLGIDAAQAAALLARALLALDRAAEAEALSHESEKLAGDDLKAAIAWRGVRAEALARRGEHVAAVDLARAAVDIAAATDALLDHADALLALAAALRASGRGEEAAAEEARAIELWEAKGATLLAERARREVKRVEVVAERRVTPPPRGVTRRVPPTAAIARVAPLVAAVTAKDLDAIQRLIRDDYKYQDHENGMVMDRADIVSYFGMQFAARDSKCRMEILGSLGDALVLVRVTLTGSGVTGHNDDAGPYEMGFVTIQEIDEDGRQRRAEGFPLHRLGDAVARLYERHAEILPEGPERARAEAMMRCASAWFEANDFDRVAATFAASVEFADHRRIGLPLATGAPNVRDLLRTLFAAADDLEFRCDDILDLRPDAWLLCVTNTGTDRVGGGGFERRLLQLWHFGGDGLVTRNELFDIDSEDHAVARIDELATPSVATSARRVRPNHATAAIARLDAAIVARDADALPDLFSEAFETVDHVNGVALDRGQQLSSFQYAMSTRDRTFQNEPLGTLGDSLALFRLKLSGSGAGVSDLDVASFDYERTVVVETDAGRRIRRVELFASDQLGDAGARMYERFAELLPEGPERARAAATARSMAALVGPFDPDRYATALGGSFEFADNRRLLGLGAGTGPEAFLSRFRSLADLADDLAIRLDDVLAARSNGFLTQHTNSGIERVGGGRFERQYLSIWIFGDDGLATHQESFDTDSIAEALARFDELKRERSTSASAVKRPRRVGVNAATVHATRLDTALTARDADVLPSLLSDEDEAIDRQGTLATWRSLLHAEDLKFRHDPLATLGDSLALFRLSIAASGAAGARFDVGAYEIEQLVLVETDTHGRSRRNELFAIDHLGDAVVRLYERCAELLPDPAARARMAATARSVAAWVGLLDLDRLASQLADDVEFVDHRKLGTSSSRGKKALLQNWRSMVEVAEGPTYRIDDVLALRPDSVLAYWTHFGTGRASGGRYDRSFLGLLVFGGDGLMERKEAFDVDREAEALARFDELTAEPPRPSVNRRVRPNAATLHATRLEIAMAARDLEGACELDAESAEMVDHVNGATYDRQEIRRTRTMMLQTRELNLRHEPLATLGDSLAILRVSILASGVTRGNVDAGPYEMQRIMVSDVDGEGRSRRVEMFATEHPGDAIARLYERYAELLAEGPARARAEMTAYAVIALLGPFDLDLWVAAAAADFEGVDHRTLGTWSCRGVEAARHQWLAMLEVADDVTFRIDDVLALRPDALLARYMNSGTDRAGGGRYERPALMIHLFRADGLRARTELFDADRDAEALARFDELTAEPSRPSVKRRVRPNAATADAARLDATIKARDTRSLSTSFADDLRVTDHTTGIPFDRQGALRSYRAFLNARDPTHHLEPLATLGDSLAVCRLSLSASGIAAGEFDVGAYAKEEIHLIEVDAQGRRRRGEVFAIDRVGDAIIRLYERYAELLPEGPARDRAAVAARSVGPFTSEFDGKYIDRMAAALAPGVEAVDHRRLGTWFANGAEATLDHFRALVTLADDIVFRHLEVLDLAPDVLLDRMLHLGVDRSSGGRYEREFLVMLGFGADGRVARIEWFDADREAEALARFDELTAATSRPSVKRRVRPNAATANAARMSAAVASRDADALSEVFADDASMFRHTTRSAFDRRALLGLWRGLIRAEGPALAFEPLATLGDALALGRFSTSASGLIRGNFDVGHYEIEEIVVGEVDACGRYRQGESFASDRLGDAIVRLYERYAELLPEGPAHTRATATARSVGSLLGPYDPDRYAAGWAPDVEGVDHRTLGTWFMRGANELARANQAWFDIADDLAMRNEDILGLHPEVLLLRRTFSGRERLGGGAFERSFLHLLVFGKDGLLVRLEHFDTECENDALARFDELTTTRSL